MHAVRANGGRPDKRGHVPSLWTRQRDALIIGSYKALNAGDLQLVDLRPFLELNVTAPIAGHLYDRVMGGDPSPRGALTPERLERLLDSAERHVRTSWSAEYFAAIQSRRAIKRWEGRAHTVADLERAAGMSISESALALGCSTATVKRLRAKARAADS